MPDTDKDQPIDRHQGQQWTLDHPVVRGLCVGAAPILFGVFTKGHTLTDGNCDENRLGPIPTNSQACARIGGLWTTSTGAMHIAYLAAQIVSWAFISAGVTIILAGVATELNAAQSKTGKQSSIERKGRHVARAVRDLRKGPLIPRAVAVGAIAGLALGAVTGLIRGIEVHPATAWFAAFEIGAPAAILGATIGLITALLLTASRLITARLKRPYTRNPRAS